MKKNRYIDFLAKLAVDSAHPGGRTLTEAIIRDLSLQAHDQVLDVGCGTGATASLLSEKKGAVVTGIDIHPKMVERAAARAAVSENPFRVITGSAECLPFADNKFDWVISESVTAFTDIHQSVPEYFRVLRPGKKLIAIEMTIEKSLPEQDGLVIKKLYGVPELYTEEEWQRIWNDAGFICIESLRDSDFILDQNQNELPSYQLSGGLDEEAFEVWLDHMQMLQTYKDVLSYRIYRMEKPPTSE